MPSLGLTRSAALVALTLSALTALVGPPAQAAQPDVKWDSSGMADISAPPFTFSLELSDYTNPREITQRGTVDVDVSATLDEDACQAPVAVTPLRDGTAIGGPEYTDAVDSYGDSITVRVPVASAGTYALQIAASVETGDYLCSASSVTSTQYAFTIELFTIAADLPGPASREPVRITSYGPHTLVANTWGRTGSIPITFTITDPLKRKDLLHSICMTDTSDCWFEDGVLKPTSYIHRTSTGWTRTWGFWWERTSPSDCVSYYWEQPDVSVILVVSNRDGKVIGRKKHTVKLTCRL